MSTIASTIPTLDQIKVNEVVVVEEEEELEDGLPSFDLVEIDETLSILKAERILKARLAATDYKAKIEEAGWYFNTKPTIKGSPRPEMFSIHQLYIKRSYSEACRIGLECLKKVTGAEFIEVLDLVLRSSLRSEVEISLEVVQAARKYFPFRKAHPGLCYSTALVLSSAPPSLSVSKLEALEASLFAATRKSIPYYSLTFKLIRETGNELLADFLNTPSHLRWDNLDVAVIEKAVINTGLSEEGRTILKTIIGSPGENEVQEEEEVLRDVRNM